MEPLDLNVDKNFKALTASMEQWNREMSENKDGSKYGYPADIKGVQLERHGRT